MQNLTSRVVECMKADDSSWGRIYQVLYRIFTSDPCYRTKSPRCGDGSDLIGLLLSGWS